MGIDWGAFLLVALVAVVSACFVVSVYSVGLRFWSAADTRAGKYIVKDDGTIGPATSGFPDPNAAAGAVRIDDGRDLVVGRDRQEVRRHLVALADVHRHHPVGQAAFLEHDRDLPPVGRAPGMNVDGLVGGGGHGKRSAQVRGAS